MNLEQIEDMLVAFRGDDPVERAEGMRELAKFLFNQQDERTRKANYVEQKPDGWPKLPKAIPMPWGKDD